MEAGFNDARAPPPAQHQSFAKKSGPSTSHPAVPAFGTASDDLNILLLGETGVGKSTFINALCNYLLYPTLREACDGEMQSLIYTEFSMSDEDGNEVNVVAGTPNKDEDVNTSKGNSSTQKCKAYTFRIGEKRNIRLIDTPGIGDTRGFDQDVKNTKNIISFISRYDVLHAICILLKPNETRLTISLKYCIIELLAQLHKDASSNILFCFTNSRATLYRPGGTKKLLERLLSESSKTASIKLDRNTMFHFDSEGFRFLAAVNNKVAFKDHEFKTYEDSWKQSADEAGRLIQHIASLEPHDIQSTLSLNKVRGMLISIEHPLAGISAAILKNMDENKKNMTQFIERQGNHVFRPEEMTIKEEIQIAEVLKHPRTVCNSSTCKGKRICHDDCKTSETLTGSLVAGIVHYFTGDEYVFCEVLSLRSGKCKKCQCGREYHVRMTHELKTVVQERVDEALRKVIAESQNEYERMKNMTKALDEREKEYKNEMEIVVNAAALFNGFLIQNSIFSFNTATREYLEDQIKKKEAAEDNSTEQGRARIAELKKLLADYTRRIENFRNRSGPSSGRDVTIEDVRGELQKLFALPRFGDSLRILIEDQENEYRSVVTRADEIPVEVSSAQSIRAPGSRPEGGTSLMQKLANLTILTKGR